MPVPPRHLRAGSRSSQPGVWVRTRLVLGTLGVVLAVFGAITPAQAWEVQKSSNGIVVTRDWSEDTTQTATVTVYYNYKGGTSYSGSWNPFSFASYNSSRVMPSFSTGGAATGLELPLEPGHRIQMVYVSGGGVNRSFVVLNEPLDVLVANAELPVSMDASVSVDGTLPVAVESVGGVGSSGLTAAVGAWLLMVGIVSYGGLNGR